jgi:choline transport protein
MSLTYSGWITIFAWMIAAAGPPAIIANIITALAAFTHETYTPKGWHTMLMMWALIIVPFIFNLWFRKLLNLLESLGGVCHVGFYLISIVVLVILANRSTDEFVFKTLTHGQSGWENLGVTWGLGLLTITFSVNGKF